MNRSWGEIMPFLNDGGKFQVRGLKKKNKKDFIGVNSSESPLKFRNGKPRRDDNFWKLIARIINFKRKFERDK